MPMKTAPRVRETSITTGVATYTLAGAPSGFQSFSVMGAGNLCPYVATDGLNWESGIGTILVGPNRLERTHVLDSSNAGAAVDWAPGTRTLRCGLISAFAFERYNAKDVAGAAGNTVLTQNEQRIKFMVFTGVLTGNRTLEVDATPWTWIVYNNTSGAFSLTLRVAGQPGVAIPQGRRAVVYCDGVDVRFASAPAVSNGSEFPTGTPMLFVQTAAPVGWTKSVTHNDKALRVVSGVVGSGGATAFSSVFGAGKNAGATTITTATQAPHLHSIGFGGAVAGGANANWGPSSAISGTHPTGNGGAEGGSGGSHLHTLSLDLQYADVIIATKD